ncbi:MAG: tetratricopeptide repeat protein [Candidatus Sumerlaeia bacterium]
MKDKRSTRGRAARKEAGRRRRDAAASAAAPRMRPADLLAPVLLLVLTFIIYWPALAGEFLWDDTSSILENPLMRQEGGLRLIWTTVGSIPQESHYWPVTYTALWLQFRLWGASPVGYHVVNLLIYAAIAVQILRLMRRLGLPGAWLGALLFLLHPVHVETVAWIIGIKDLLATALGLLAAGFFLNHLERGGWKWLAWSCVAAAAAVLSKTTPVALPLVLAIVLWHRDGRIGRRGWGALAALAAVAWSIAAGDMIVAKRLANPLQEVTPLADRLVQAGWAFWLYVLKLAWPAGLSPFYPIRDLSPARPLDWLPLAAAAAAAALAWLMRGRLGRGPVASWLFYCVCLAPVVGVIFIDFLLLTPAADRYQFMASIGPIAGIAALAGGAVQKQRLKWMYAPVALVLIALAALSWRQAGYYQDMEKLFVHAQKIAPDSSEVCSTLGYVYSRQGRYDEAEELLRKAVRIRPKDWNAVCHLGTLMANQNRIRNAVTIYTEAVNAGCNNADVLANLAWLLATTPDPNIYNPARALELAKMSLGGSNAVSPTYLNALAAAQMATGQTAEGLGTARQALQLARDTHSLKLAAFIEKLIPLYEQGQPCIMRVRDESR